MNGPDYEHFCRLVAQRSGLILGPDKAYLVSTRLEPVARGLGMGGAAALLTLLRTAPRESLIQTCVDAMATHESLFFRDATPFDQLAETVLPALAHARAESGAIRVWCAACSSGQEPYSIAMLALENAHRLAGRRVEIVATDMVEAILLKARLGLYSEFEVRRGLSPERMTRWMRPMGAQWQVEARVRSMVEFRPHNLLDSARPLGRFDIIFCRNVLIYFDPAGKRQVFGQIAQVLASDGALFLGSAESPLGLSDAFQLEPGARGLYRARAGAARAA